MKHVNNPWAGKKGYHCWGCDPNSEHGLQMDFYEDGEEIVSRWKPRPEFQGWVDTLHGGIQAALVDEISSWVIFTKRQTSGVTTKMEVRYRHPISTRDEYITLRAKVADQRRNLIRLAVKIYNHAGDLCTEATCDYFLFSKEKAVKDFNFLECSTEECNHEECNHEDNAHSCGCCAHEE